MDILRAALGERQLDYFGASYGTLLGATYADLFPANVRRMVLDGAVDPSLSNEELSLGQARGLPDRARRLPGGLRREGDCVLGDTVDGGARRIRAAARRARRQPLPTSGDRELTEGLAVRHHPAALRQGVLAAARPWRSRQAIEDGDGDRLLALSDQYTSRGPDGYTDNSHEALYAVNCLDHGDSVPVEQVPQPFDGVREGLARRSGGVFAYGLSTLRLLAGEERQDARARSTPPARRRSWSSVRRATRPRRTSWATALAAQLSRGVLVSRDGDGHTGFQQGNSCVDDAVERLPGPRHRPGGRPLLLTAAVELAAGPPHLRG